MKRSNSKKILCKMLITMALMLLPGFATAQEKTVTLQENSITIIDAFANIEKQTGYSVGYLQTGLDMKKQISVNVKNATVKESVTTILRGTNHTFKIEGYHIVIVPEKEKKDRKENLNIRTISGTVVDSISQKIIADASIELVRNTPLRTRTNKNGYFRLQKVAPGTYAIKVSIDGYSHSVYREVKVENKDEHIDIYLSNNKTEEVTRERILGNISKKSVSVLNTAEVSNEPMALSSDIIIPNTLPFHRKSLPTIAIKSNLLYDLTSSISLGVELRLSKRLTLDVSGTYNPWEFTQTKMFKHIMVQPELRYWEKEPFNKSFWGLHGIYSHYNVGGWNMGSLKEKRYQGDMYGVGISYGYNWYLTPRWSLEGTLGIGYTYMDDVYQDCETCPDVKGLKNRNQHYWGPTKAGLSIIYHIK